MSNITRNYLSDDNQIPCSSNNYGYQPLYPPNNANVPTQNSPYCHSSGPPSVSLTPAPPFPASVAMEPQAGAVPPAYTQSWIQNYHDVPTARPQSSAPSVMSDLTMFSGISVNTQATTTSYAVPPGMGPVTGPLSSRSHSENIEPSENIVNHINEIMPFITETDPLLRRKAAMLLIQVAEKMRLADNIAGIYELIVNLTKTIVMAVKHEQDVHTRVLFCDALYRFVNKFPTLYAKMLSNETKPGSSDNTLGTLLSFFTEKAMNPDNRRFLRHLFPILYAFISTRAVSSWTGVAKNTNLVGFIYYTLRERFATLSTNINAYQTPMKFFVRYLEMLRHLIRFDDNIRLKLVEENIIDLLLNITRFHCTHHNVLAPRFITAYHNEITAVLKMIVTTKSEKITDTFVLSGAIEVLLTAVFCFRRIDAIHNHALFYTFTSLAYVGDSKQLQKISPRLTMLNKDMFEVIHMESMKAHEKQDFDTFKVISEFVVNASRHVELQNQIIYYGHFELLADVFFRFYTSPDKKYRDVSDNCLLTLYRLCYVNGEPFRVFCDFFFSMRFAYSFAKIFYSNNVELIRRALHIWKVLIPKVTAPFFYNVYSNMQIYVTQELLRLINFFFTQLDSPNSLAYMKLAELSIELLLTLARQGLCQAQLMPCLEELNLIGFLYQIGNGELSLCLLNLINELRQLYPELTKSCLPNDRLREALHLAVQSTHMPMVNLSQKMLAQIDDNVFAYAF